MDKLFFSIYGVEALVKIIGLGPRKYLSKRWHMFDASLVAFGALDIVLEQVGEEDAPLSLTFLRVIRIARLSRMLRLMRAIKGLGELLKAIVPSLPALANVTSLLAVLLFVYAILGVQLFWRVAYSSHITPYANFSSVGWALLTLFRVVTGDEWNGLMHDYLVTEELYPERCSAAEDNCGSWLAVPFFVSFTMLSSFVILNLVIAVILENFNTADEAENRAHVPASNIDEFCDLWSGYDAAASGVITVGEFEALILVLSKPLGLRAADDARPTRTELMARVATMDLPVYNGHVSFQECLLALLLSARDVVSLPAHLPVVHSLNRVVAAWHARAAVRSRHGQRATSYAEIRATVQMQTSYRARRLRRVVRSADVFWGSMDEVMAAAGLKRYDSASGFQISLRLRVPLGAVFLSSTHIGICVKDNEASSEDVRPRRPPLPSRSLLTSTRSSVQDPTALDWVPVRIVSLPSCAMPIFGKTEAGCMPTSIIHKDELMEVEYIATRTSGEIVPSLVCNQPYLALRTICGGKLRRSSMVTNISRRMKRVSDGIKRLSTSDSTDWSATKPRGHRGSGDNRSSRRSQAL